MLMGETEVVAPAGTLADEMRELSTCARTPGGKASTSTAKWLLQRSIFEIRGRASRGHNNVFLDIEDIATKAWAEEGNDRKDRSVMDRLEAAAAQAVAHDLAVLLSAEGFIVTEKPAGVLVSW